MSDRYTYVDMQGRVFLDGTTEDKIRGMTSPVRCGACGRIYDLGTVTVTQRYADCSVWKAPCCKVTTDDRTWSHPQYEELRLR